MRALLNFLFLLFISIPLHAQISGFPYHQGFETPFKEHGTDVYFTENWFGNQVQATKARIYHAGENQRNGNYALSVQPIASFDGQIIMDLDLTGMGQLRVHFYARTIKNGTGSRPLLVVMSTSIDGGANYIHKENIGDETSFPNQDTEYALYKYDIPASAGNKPDVKLKIDIIYTVAFGDGTAARIFFDDFHIFAKDENIKILDIIIKSPETLQIIFNQEIDISQPFHS